ncbi:membrane protein of ER body-like protein [Rhodamnia argentea]|uniref:Membrane protein of ER body-like protein n=1 Tax=Rhodamnia argentea TaxID=178133 RepID=A0ABM3GU93_9MYRT|nr:membrane protein of ER body-like protein [Rhodamnia argentea]
MKAQAQLQQHEEEEYNLKVEVEEGEMGLLRRQSTRRKHGVDERDASGSANVSRTSNNGTDAEEEPEAEQEWVEEVNEGKNGVEEQGPETEAEQEPCEEVTNAETIVSFKEQRPDDNDGEDQEAAPEPDEADDYESHGCENGKGDGAILAPAARTELDTDNGVEGKGSTWTNIVHFDDERGTESIQTIVKTEYCDIEQVLYETETLHETSDVATERFSVFLSSQVDHQGREISGDERFLDSALLSPRKSPEEKNTCSKESKVVEEVDLIEELNPEETGFDVEKVLEKQNTHDLYCPNCHSCITRRVILRRKKRKVRNVRYRVKYDKVEKTTASELHAHPVTVVEEDRSVDAITSVDEVPTPAAIDNISRPELNGHHNDSEPEAYRCLSCFSIFIPRGDAFKLFRLFGERKEVEKVQDPSEVPVAKNNAVTEASRMHLEHGDSTAVIKKLEAFVSSTEGTSVTIEESSDMGLLNYEVSLTKEAEKETVSPLKDVTNDLKKEASINTEQDPGETLAAIGQSLENAYTKPQTVQVIPPLIPVASVVRQTSIERDQKSVKETSKELPAVSALSAITEVLPSPAQPSLAESQKVADSAIKLRQPQVEVASQTGTQTLAEEPQVAQVHQPREWDILKSIIYGGLTELITSLGVVSSAAGAGASTLNTLGLGLANLFGGLLVIAHNLRELKNEQPSQGTEQVDRYQEVLGKRQHFPLHATVAIVSFIIFGCVAPITYAFSFRESDNRDYKLAAVAGASLSCIFLLAIGKAHVRKPPKTYFKTVLYYVIMGFMASGVSFLVGELIDKLLTKLGWFDSTSSMSGTGPLETGTLQSGWATY